MVATRQTTTTVSVVFLTKITGLADDPQSFGTLEVRGSDLYSSGTKVGTADGTNMNIDVTDNTGVRTIIRSKKQ